MREQYYSSTAYDFDLFLPAEKREREPKKNNITPLPRNVRRKTEERKAARANRQTLRAVSSKLSGFLAIVFMVGMACGIIQTRVKISEARNAYNAASKEMEKLEREEVRLNMLIENRCAFGNLEQEAAALGMQKPQADQIRYITLSERDKVEIIGKNGDKAVAYLDSEKVE